jgi:hypothetical protein
VIVKTVSVVLAVVSIFKFAKQVQHRLAHQRLMVKLVAFKAIVFLNFVQTVSGTP